MKTTDILALCMVMVVVSFLGFVVENIWLAVTKGFIDNRNMFFPFLIGYGIAIMLIFGICGTPKRVWVLGKTLWIRSRIVRILVYFVGVMLCVCVGEVVLGTVVEKICHFYWWDYSGLPLHITRYTSIPTSMMFSILITVFMDCFFEPLFFFFRDWNPSVLNVTAKALMAVMIGDFAYHSYLMYKTKGMITRWKIDTKESWLYKKIHPLLQ